MSTIPPNSDTPDAPKPGWQDLPLGGVAAGGTARAYDTGNWTRTTTRWNPKTCINCNLCWPVCPHDCILMDAEGNMAGVDESKCTNCGLCIVACPTKPKSLYTEEKPEKAI